MNDRIPQFSSPDPVHAPEAVWKLVGAINTADTEAFVAAFSPDGVIDDWGRKLVGRQGQRSWAASDAIGAQAQMTLLGSETSGAVTEIRFDWRSTVFTGDGHAFVTIEDGLITQFRIPSE